MFYFAILTLLIVRNPASWPDKSLTEGCVHNEFNLLNTKTVLPAAIPEAF